MQIAAMLVTSDFSGDQHARASSAAPRNGTECCPPLVSSNLRRNRSGRNSYWHYLFFICLTTLYWLQTIAFLEVRNTNSGTVSDSTTALILNLKVNGELGKINGQLHAPAAVTPGKAPRYPLRAPEPVWTIRRQNRLIAYPDRELKPGSSDP